MNFPRFSLLASLKLNSFLTPRPHLFQLFFLFATCHSRILFFVHFLFISYGLFAYRAHFVGSAKFFLLLHSIFRATKKKTDVLCLCDTLPDGNYKFKREE